MSYDNRHRTFLQAVMQQGIVLDHDAQVLCSKIFNERINLPTIVGNINNKLSPINMLMKFGICELTGQQYWSVIATTHHENLIIPSEFSIVQRAFLREIYSELVSSDDGSISSTDCLNLSRTLGIKLSMGDADTFLKHLFKEKWLHIKNGYIYMGIRSILELMPYFKATYQNNFHNCMLCKEIIFHGYKCEHCSTNFHNYCLTKKIAQQKQEVCPECKNSLEIHDSLEDAADPEVNPEEQENQPMDIPDEDSEVESTPPARKKKSRKRRAS